VKKCSSLEYSLDANDFEYQSYTFCNHDEAVEIAVNIKLNTSFTVSNKIQAHPKWNKKIVQNWSKSSRILFVVIYTPHKRISDFYRDVFLDEMFAVSFLNSNYMLSPSYLTKNILSATDFLRRNSERLLMHIDSATWDHEENYRPYIPINYFGVFTNQSLNIFMKII